MVGDRGVNLSGGQVNTDYSDLSLRFHTIYGVVEIVDTDVLTEYIDYRKPGSVWQGLRTRP